MHDGTAGILVAGPAMSRVLLDPVGDALAARGCAVKRWFGPMDGLVDDPAWAEAGIFVCYGMACGAAELARAPKLHTIIVPTIGYEWIDEAAATAAGIAVVNGRVPENAESMAEAAVLLILASLYDLRGAEAELRGGGSRRRPRMLKGKTVGIVGYGVIARQLAGRLRAWGVTLLAHSRSGAENDEAVTFLPLDDLLRQSDAIVLLASLNPDSYHLIDARRLALIRSDALLVNLGRGGLIDERALEAHLSAGRLEQVALDVFEEEPLPPESPLRAFPGAILTPHAIGHTVESFAAIPRVAAANAMRAAAGEMPESLCNRSVAPFWKRTAGHLEDAE
jgi:phosphoglycerate dehydrogenase-like enzyme